MRQLPREGKTNGRTRRTAKAPTHHAGLDPIPCSFLRNGSALRRGSSWYRDQPTSETICFIEVTSKDINGGLSQLGHACIQFSSRTGSNGHSQLWLEICVLPARSCGADLEDRQSVFRTLWRVHGSWFLAILAEFRTPVSHEIVLSIAMSLWLYNGLSRPAEARQLPWCDVETFDGSLSPKRTESQVELI